MIAARTLYVQYWRKEKIPTKEEWIVKLYHLLELDKLMKKLNDEDSNKYKKHWRKFKEYLENY